MSNDPCHVAISLSPPETAGFSFWGCIERKLPCQTIRASEHLHLSNLLGVTPTLGSAWREEPISTLSVLPAGLKSPQSPQWSAAGTPSPLQTVTAPVSGPASARSRVVVSSGRPRASDRKFRLPLAVSHTTRSGSG